MAAESRKSHSGSPSASVVGPNPLASVSQRKSCARRSDDADVPSGVASDPMSAGLAFILPHLVRR